MNNSWYCAWQRVHTAPKAFHVQCQQTAIDKKQQQQQYLDFSIASLFWTSYTFKLRLEHIQCWFNREIACFFIEMVHTFYLYLLQMSRDIVVIEEYTMFPSVLKTGQSSIVWIKDVCSKWQHRFNIWEPNLLYTIYVLVYFLFCVVLSYLLAQISKHDCYMCLWIVTRLIWFKAWSRRPGVIHNFHSNKIDWQSFSQWNNVNRLTLASRRHKRDDKHEL